MNAVRQSSFAAVAVLMAGMLASPSGVVAKEAAPAKASIYKPTVPTATLDPWALQVVRQFSRGSGTYGVMRASLLRLGWRPDPSVDCVAAFAGDEGHKLCLEKPGTQDCALCRAMPELESCSSGPVEYCLADFVHPGSRVVLHITTGGDLQNTPNDAGPDAFTFIAASSRGR